MLKFVLFQVIFALCGTVVNAAIGIHCCCTRYPNIETKGAVFPKSVMSKILLLHPELERD